MEKLQLTYAEIEQLQFYLKECIKEWNLQEEISLKNLEFKLIAMRAQLENLKMKGD